MKEIQTTVSARVPETLSQQVDELATALKRSRSWVIEEALRSYVTRESQFIAAVKAGIEAYENGDIVDHADVVAAFEQRRSQ